MGNIFAELPELRAASRTFRREQLEAFVGYEPPLCGIEVVPLTPRIAMELELADNAILNPGQDVKAEDILQFIHRVSKGYRPGDRKQISSLAKLLYTKRAQEGVDEYVERAHAARPSFERSSQPDFVPSDSCWMSYVIDSLCRWYPHLTVDGALDLPYRIMWQLWQRRLEDTRSDYVQKAPGVMKARQKYLEDLDRKHREEFEAEKLKRSHGRRS